MSKPRLPRMKSHVFAIACPFCGAQHDLASNLPGHKSRPKDGDRSLCIRCGEMSIFSCLAVGGLRKPTTEEMLEQGSNVDAIRATLAWRDITRQRRKKAEAEARQQRIDDFLLRRGQ